MLQHWSDWVLVGGKWKFAQFNPADKDWGGGVFATLKVLFSFRDFSSNLMQNLAKVQNSSCLVRLLIGIYCCNAKTIYGKYWTAMKIGEFMLFLDQDLN